VGHKALSRENLGLLYLKHFFFLNYPLLLDAEEAEQGGKGGDMNIEGLEQTLLCIYTETSCGIASPLSSIQMLQLSSGHLVVSPFDSYLWLC
jgi:hypothetical protein